MAIGGATVKESVVTANRIVVEMIRAKKTETEKTEAKTKIKTEAIEAEMTRRTKIRIRTRNENEAEKGNEILVGTERIMIAKRKITEIVEEIEKRRKIKRKMIRRTVSAETVTEETTKMIGKMTKERKRMTEPRKGVTNETKGKTIVNEKRTEVVSDEGLVKVVLVVREEGVMKMGKKKIREETEESLPEGKRLAIPKWPRRKGKKKGGEVGTELEGERKKKVVRKRKRRKRRMNTRSKWNR